MGLDPLSYRGGRGFPPGSRLSRHMRWGSELEPVTATDLGVGDIVHWRGERRIVLTVAMSGDYHLSIALEGLASPLLVGRLQSVDRVRRD